MFKKWFTEQFFAKHPCKIIVMDNAPYHSVQLNKTPTSSTVKWDIIKWLTENLIRHDTSHTRPSVSIHKKKLLRYETAELVHAERRLPHYFCQFNLTELIRAQVKDEKKQNYK